MSYTVDRQVTGTGRRASAPTPLAIGLGTRPKTATVGDPPSAFVRAALDDQLRRLLAKRAGIRDGGDSAEDVHQMRVAIRRIRAALSAGAGLIDVDDELTGELKWLGGLLGVVRDLDVLRQRVDGRTPAFSPADRPAFDEVIGVLARQRADASAALLVGLNSRRYAGLLRTLAELVRQKDEKSATKIVPNTLIAKPYRVLEKSISAMPKTPNPQQLHSARIRAKRLRYAAELVAPQLKKHQAKPFIELVSATKKLQELLGEYQDTIAAEQQLRAIAEGERTPLSSQALIVIGRLIESEYSLRAKPLRRWPAAWQDVKQRAKAILD